MSASYSTGLFCADCNPEITCPYTSFLLSMKKQSFLKEIEGKNLCFYSHIRTKFKKNLLSRKTELNMHADDMKFFLGFRHEPCKDASKASYSSDINPVNGDCIR